jgi:hypothetical protein
MVRSRPGSRNPKEGSLTKSPCPKFKRQVLSCSLPTKSGPPEVFVFHTVLGVEMAAQGGIRDKILRVSMPFEKGRNSIRKTKKEIPVERQLSGTLSDPWSVVLKVRSWAAQRRDGRVHLCSEVARREGITRARVSQLWSLGKITREQVDNALTMSRGRGISLRRLIRIARNSDMK